MECEDVKEMGKYLPAKADKNTLKSIQVENVGYNGVPGKLIISSSHEQAKITT